MHARSPAFARLQVSLAILLVAAAVALLASTFLIGATPDDEEFRFTILSTWLHVRALAQGQYSFWTSMRPSSVRAQPPNGPGVLDTRAAPASSVRRRPVSASERPDADATRSSVAKPMQRNV